MFVTDHAIYGGTIVGIGGVLIGLPIEVIVPAAILGAISEAWPDVAPWKLPFGYDWTRYSYWHDEYDGPVGCLHRRIDKWMHNEQGKWIWHRAVLGWIGTGYCLIWWACML